MRASVKNLLAKIPMPGIYHLGGANYAVPREGGGVSTVNRQSVLLHLDKAGYPNCGLAPDQPENQKEMAITRIETEQSVDWCGRVAGRHQGLRRVNGSDILVKGHPGMMQAAPGPCNGLVALLEQVLGTEVIPDRSLSPFQLFCYWLQRGRRMIRDGRFLEGQVLILCGGVDTYKSFTQGAVITPALGYEGLPAQFLKGGTGFNADIVAAEHLRIDDASPPSEAKDRSEWANVLKQLVMERTRRLHGKGRDALMVDPLQRVSIACNDSGDGYKVIPHISRDNEDKFLVFRTRVPEAANGFCSDGERRAYTQRIASELQGFLQMVDNLGPVPESDTDMRFGVRGYIHPELRLLVNDEQPEDSLLAALNQLFIFGVRTIEGSGEQIFRRMEEAQLANALQFSAREAPGAGTARLLVLLSQNPATRARVTITNARSPKHFRIVAPELLPRV
jgi:hypothetical protein